MNLVKKYQNVSTRARGFPKVLYILYVHSVKALEHVLVLLISSELFASLSLRVRCLQMPETKAVSWMTVFPTLLNQKYLMRKHFSVRFKNCAAPFVSS